MNQPFRTGKVIKSLRASAGYLSTREFAKDCSLSRETLRTIENGAVLPSNDSLLHILKVLEVPPESESGREAVAALHEDRRNKAYGSAAANKEISKFLDGTTVSEEKVAQLLSLFAEYINPDRQSDSFLHFLRTRIEKIME